jgi:hypothetical protein
MLYFFLFLSLRTSLPIYYIHTLISSPPPKKTALTRTKKIKGELLVRECEEEALAAAAA